MRINKKIKKTLLMGMIAGALCGMLLTFAAAKSALSKKQAIMNESQAKIQTELETLKVEVDKRKILEAAATLSQNPVDDWELVFLNYDHPLDQAYAPELAEVTPGFLLDTRIVESAKLMLADAATAGLNMAVVSAYRSFDDQRSVFNSTMLDWMNQGYPPIDAYDETKKSVAVPGHSEHALGLAMDIVSATNPELEESQSETAETKWLVENSYKYGFIVRYPASSTDITKITYEPWHYRYVGIEAAKEIWEKDITLEEYLGIE